MVYPYIIKGLSGTVLVGNSFVSDVFHICPLSTTETGDIFTVYTDYNRNIFTVLDVQHSILIILEVRGQQPKPDAQPPSIMHEQRGYLKHASID